MADLLELTSRAEAAHFWFHGFRQFVAPALATLAGSRRDLRMVDCGAGTGANLQLLQPYGRAFAFDLAPNGLLKARGEGPSLVRADITRIPFIDGAFDISTSFDVLQCVPDDRGAVREMARITTRGGGVVLTLAALDVLRGDHAEVWNEVRRYTPATAEALIRQAGLRPLAVRFMFCGLFPLMLGVRVAQRMTRRFRDASPDSDIAVPREPMNRVLKRAMDLEASLAARVAMPIGSSLLVVARKD